jgi:hypothetical protein
MVRCFKSSSSFWDPKILHSPLFSQSIIHHLLCLHTMTEPHSFVHELLLSVYQRLTSAVASILRRYKLSKRSSNSKKQSATRKTTSEHGLITKSSLGSRILDLEQLADEAGVDLYTVWQAALASTLHFYNFSEALSFAIDDCTTSSSAGSDDEANICSLRVEPAETAVDLLQRLYDSTDVDANSSSKSQVSWKRVGNADAPYCKYGIQIQDSDTSKTFPTRSNEVCAILSF